MCKPASMVLTREKVFWSKTSDSHEDIVAEFNLCDDDVHNVQIVRVEITPPDDTRFDALLETWQYRVDQDILPDWYDPADAEKRTRIALVRWCEHKVVREGCREVREGVLYASSSARVDASDNASVTASDNASVYAFGSASVTAYGSASVDAYGSASVTAYDSATITIRCGNPSIVLKSAQSVCIDRRVSQIVCHIGPFTINPQ